MWDSGIRIRVAAERKRERWDHLACILWTVVNESLFYFPWGVREIYYGLTCPQFFNWKPLPFIISFPMCILYQWGLWGSFSILLLNLLSHLMLLTLLPYATQCFLVCAYVLPWSLCVIALMCVCFYSGPVEHWGCRIDILISPNSMTT